MSLSPAADDLCRANLESEAVKASGTPKLSDLSLDAEDIKKRMVTGGAGLSLRLQSHQLQSREREHVSLSPAPRQLEDAQQSRFPLPDLDPVPSAANLAIGIGEEGEDTFPSISATTRRACLSQSPFSGARCLSVH